MQKKAILPKFQKFYIKGELLKFLFFSESIFLFVGNFLAKVYRRLSTKTETQTQTSGYNKIRMDKHIHITMYYDWETLCIVSLVTNVYNIHNVKKKTNESKTNNKKECKTKKKQKTFNTHQNIFLNLEHELYPLSRK